VQRNWNIIGETRRLSTTWKRPVSGLDRVAGPAAGRELSPSMRRAVSRRIRGIAPLDSSRTLLISHSAGCRGTDLPLDGDVLRLSRACNRGFRPGWRRRDRNGRQGCQPATGRDRARTRAGPPRVKKPWEPRQGVGGSILIRSGSARETSPLEFQHVARRACAAGSSWPLSYWRNQGDAIEIQHHRVRRP